MSVGFMSYIEKYFGLENNYTFWKRLKYIHHIDNGCVYNKGAHGVCKDRRTYKKRLTSFKNKERGPISLKHLPVEKFVSHVMYKNERWSDRVWRNDYLAAIRDNKKTDPTYKILMGVRRPRWFARYPYRLKRIP
eukprot:UN16601